MRFAFFLTIFFSSSIECKTHNNLTQACEAIFYFSVRCYRALCEKKSSKDRFPGRDTFQASRTKRVRNCSQSGHSYRNHPIFRISAFIWLVQAPLSLPNTIHRNISLSNILIKWRHRSFSIPCNHFQMNGHKLTPDLRKRTPHTTHLIVKCGPGQTGWILNML